MGYYNSNPQTRRQYRIWKRFSRRFVRAHRWRDGGTQICKFSTIFFVLGALIGLVLFLNIMDTDDKLKYVALDRSKHMIAFIGVIAMNVVGLVVVLLGRFLYWKGSSLLQSYDNFVTRPITLVATPSIAAQNYINNGRGTNRNYSRSHRHDSGFYRH